MTTAIIITLCALILVAYLFDLTALKTKVPAVIFLLFFGWILNQVATYFAFSIPSMTNLLPVLGTIGLILIVLEGSLELEFNPSKFPLIIKSLINALVPILILAFGLAWLLTYFGFTNFRTNLLNVIPICVISSSIAIPSTFGLSSRNKEFVIYESSFSDILGILFFNFIDLNQSFGFEAFGEFSIQLIIMLVVSLVATLALAYLLNKIGHHIKYIPIITLVILIYAVSKIYHLPGLIFILIFGLFLGNLDELKQFEWIKKLRPDTLNHEVKKFKDLLIEGAFLIRALFFILFGYSIVTAEMLNADTFIWAVCITAAIFVIRALILSLTKVPLSPLMFIAPRGLITILLFLSIIPEESLPLVNKSLIIQIVLLSTLVMMVGLMLSKNKPEDDEKTVKEIDQKTEVIPK